MDKVDIVHKKFYKNSRIEVISEELKTTYSTAWYDYERGTSWKADGGDWSSTYRMAAYFVDSTSRNIYKSLMTNERVALAQKIAESWHKYADYYTMRLKLIQTNEKVTFELSKSGIVGSGYEYGGFIFKKDTQLLEQKEKERFEHLNREYKNVQIDNVTPEHCNKIEIKHRKYKKSKRIEVTMAKLEENIGAACYDYERAGPLIPDGDDFYSEYRMSAYFVDENTKQIFIKQSKWLKLELARQLAAEWHIYADYYTMKLKLVEEKNNIQYKMSKSGIVGSGYSKGRLDIAEVNEKYEQVTSKIHGCLNDLHQQAIEASNNNKTNEASALYEKLEKEAKKYLMKYPDDETIKSLIYQVEKYEFSQHLNKSLKPKETTNTEKATAAASAAKNSEKEILNQI